MLRSCALDVRDDRFAVLLGPGRGAGMSDGDFDARRSAPVVVSEPATVLLAFAERSYIDRGYLSEGAVSPVHLTRRQVSMDEQEFRAACLELVAVGALQLRGSQEESYMLPPQRRAALIERHDLARVWERDHACFHPNDPHNGEVPLTLREAGRRVS